MKNRKKNGKIRNPVIRSKTETEITEETIIHEFKEISFLETIKSKTIIHNVPVHIDASTIVET